MTGARVLILVLAVGIVAAFLSAPVRGERGAIERRLGALAAEVNAGTTDGSGLAAHAEQLGSYFTDDAVVDLGRGTSEIRGRSTVVDVASRLEPATSAFKLQLTDVGVTLGADPLSAEVVLTAQFIRLGSRDDALDAREFSLGMAKASGEWRIARATAVDAFR